MKKIYNIAMLLLVGAFALTACDDDNESNPTATTPTTFVLNQPSVSENIDLSRSSSIGLSWSQPRPFNNFDAPVVPDYTVEISPTGSFTKQFDANLEDNTGADFFAMEETYNNGTDVQITPSAINRFLIQLLGWDSEGSVPDLLPLTVRVKASLVDAGFHEHNTVYSNTVNLTAIPFYEELKPADPEIWWLIGADIADGSWSSDLGKCVIPLQIKDKAEYDTKTGQGEISWTGYLAGNGFKLVKIPGKWDDQWGQGDSFGSYLKNDGGSGNITVPEAGIYTVTLNTATDELKVEKATGTYSVFPVVNMAGSFNEWGDQPMTPCHTYGGAENHDWYLTINLTEGAEVKFKDNTSSWDVNWGGSLNKTSVDFWGYGTQNGNNIVIERSGNYLVFFNDITGYYWFTSAD